MNLDKLIAEAKERLHRSIGQRARWAHAALARQHALARKRRQEDAISRLAHEIFEENRPRW